MLTSHDWSIELFAKDSCSFIFLVAVSKDSRFELILIFHVLPFKLLFRLSFIFKFFMILGER